MYPRRGARRALVDTANRNAEQAFQEVVDTAQQSRRNLEKLCARLHLDLVPQRIECFDISNLSDTALVGSMVVFVDGEPDPPSYRTFKIKTVSGQDDFASLMEVLSRRIRRSQDQLEPWPDLMVIDGGKGQLNRVVQVLEELGVGHLHVVSLAKSRLTPPQEGQPEDDRVHTEERVFLRGVKDPIALKPHTAELYLMQRIRDEAHRVAITYHRKLRNRRALGSVLDRIAGVGEQRRTELLRHFGSVRRVKAASEEELMEVKGISSALAQRIRRALDGVD